MLQSIRSYFNTDDDFNWNYGLALAATGKYKEAQEALAAVQQEAYRSGLAAFLPHGGTELLLPAHAALRQAFKRGFGHCFHWHMQPQSASMLTSTVSAPA